MKIKISFFLLYLIICPVNVFGQIPVDAQHSYQHINHSNPPSADFIWGQAWFQAVTIQNDHIPNDGFIKVDFIALIEEDIATGKDSVLHFENYNTNGPLFKSEGGLYNRFPSWYSIDDYTSMSNSSRDSGILTINVGTKPDSISHFWGIRKYCQLTGKRYKIQTSILIHGNVSMQAGMDYWINTETTSKDTLFHREALLSKWFSDTNGKYDTITYPVYEKLPRFDNKDYGFNQSGQFYLSKRLVDYVDGTEVELSGDVTDWHPEMMHPEGDFYIINKSFNTNNKQLYCYRINKNFYVPHAVFFLVNHDDCKLNDSGGYNFFTGPAPIPVELSLFNAEIKNSGVELSWSTATENNNMGFDIERKSMSDNWSKIGFINGSGTTSEISNYLFIDKTPPTGRQLYRLKQIDFDGSFSYSNEVSLYLDFKPKEYSLSQNYPNPFNPSTTIKFNLPRQSNVSLKVLNLLGEEIAALVNEEKPAGSYEIYFNATGITSGCYFYSIKAGEFMDTRKFILLK